MRIGEVAERTGLSLRTIRYYEEVGLVVPSARSRGGFRLYTEPDLGRLLLIRRMKPLGFSLDQMRDLLDTLALIDRGSTRTDLTERVTGHLDAVRARCESLRDQLAAAEGFAADLERRLPRTR
ncbi:MAG TPA: MerR family transcriptional regulator [Mycobacteriales bacterium]|nr:MerR family transcriptional regulator [Mycobacteriales bacterium]